MTAMRSCDHVVGLREDRELAFCYWKVEHSELTGGSLCQTRLSAIDERFSYCPLCGTALDWPGIEAAQEAAIAECERRAYAEADAKAKRQAAELYAFRMRGAKADV